MSDSTPATAATPGQERRADPPTTRADAWSDQRDPGRVTTTAATDEERRLLRLMEQAVETGDLPLARHYAERAQAVRNFTEARRP